MDIQELTKTILLQYSDSPKLKAMIYAFNDAIDIKDFINDFYDLVWNIRTADTYGLNVWGKIVNVSRLLTVDEVGQYFGFSEALSEFEPNPVPFDDASFYDGIKSTTTVELSNDAYRRLILAKAMANITDCTVPELNKQLLYLFQDKGCPFVTDTADMAIRYVFTFDMSASDVAIVTKSGVIPRPSGRKSAMMVLKPDATFGFCEANLQPFDQGVLFDPDKQLLTVQGSTESPQR